MRNSKRKLGNKCVALLMTMMFLACAIVLPVSAADVTLGYTYAITGSVLTLNVNLIGPNNVGAFNLRIPYDNTKLTYSTGEFGSGALFATATENAKGLSDEGGYVHAYAHTTKTENVLDTTTNAKLIEIKFDIISPTGLTCEFESLEGTEFVSLTGAGQYADIGYYDGTTKTYDEDPLVLAPVYSVSSGVAELTDTTAKIRVQAARTQPGYLNGEFTVVVAIYKEFGGVPKLMSVKFEKITTPDPSGKDIKDFTLTGTGLGSGCTYKVMAFDSSGLAKIIPILNECTAKSLELDTP